MSLARPGERPLFVTEEFASGQGFGDRAAIDNHKRLFCARAILMQAAGDDLLAGAGLTADNDRIPCRDDGFDVGNQGLNGGALAHRRGQRCADALADRGLRGACDRTPHGFYEIFVPERLRDIFESPIPDRTDRGRNGAVSRDNDDRQTRVKAFQTPQNNIAAEAGHVHIQQHDRGGVMSCLFKSCAPAIAFLNFEPDV